VPVITLVHGTWGRGVLRASGDAEWTCEQSALVQGLRGRFGDALVVRRFRWSGGNSHTARQRAAVDLRRCLLKGLDGYPNEAHLIVAHSHGGNAALQALAHPQLQSRIAGVACLATPFITARDRDLGRDPLQLVATAIVVTMFVVMWGVDASPASAWPGVIRFGLMVLLSAILMGIVVVAARAAHEQARRLIAAFSPPALPEHRLLILRAPSDEASGAISVMQFVSQLTVRLFLLVSAAHEPVVAFLTRQAARKGRVLLAALLAFVASVVCFVSYVHWSTTGGHPVLERVALVVAIAFTIGWAGCLYLVFPWIGPTGLALPVRFISGILLWPTMVALSLLMVLPFGWQVAVANLFLDVSVDSTPVGTWSMHLVEAATSTELRRASPLLVHQVYENPRAIDALVEWATRCVGY
jgi:hypothetical protein